MSCRSPCSRRSSTSIAFLLGTLAFVAAMLRTRELSMAPLVLYAAGAIPVSLRAFVPEIALDLGLVILAVGIAWLAIGLFDRSTRIAAWSATSAADLAGDRSGLALGDGIHVA